MNSGYTPERIAEICSGRLILNAPETRSENINLLVDSRKLSDPQHSLFIALEGERHDGHLFIQELFERGVRLFLVSRLTPEQQKLSANFIVVKNTLDALQSLSAFHRNQFSIPVIGITGSNGKTIIKEWLYHLLNADKNIVRSPKSYNSQVGVPISVWQMSSAHDLAIFEAGISEPGEMEKLERMILPTIGVYANIGQAHSESFENEDEKAREKLTLFKRAETLIYCKDYESVQSAVLQADFLKGTTLISWSRKTKADLVISKIEKQNGETRIQGIWKNDFIEIRIPFIDEASVENAIHCWVLMLLMGYDQEVISQRMSFLSPVAMRLEMKEGINNCSVINDSYNSDIGSLSIALDFLNQQKQHARRTLILSDILQSGRNDEALYKEIAEMISRKGVNRIIGIGKSISVQQKFFSGEKEFFESTDEFLRKFPIHSFRDETILLKGARTFLFEKISKAIQQKAHQTVLEINLNAIIHNLNFYRSRLKPGTKIMAMVKAYSYGSGSFEIANVLQFHRADYLVVAYADEGVELRRSGITLPIMVMNPEEQSFDSIISHQLEPEIYSFRILNLFTEAVKQAAMQVPALEVPIHLKIDTGMHRLGFEKKEIPELMARIRNIRSLRVRSVFSHLAASDELQHDEFTRKQAGEFSEVVEIIRGQVNYSVQAHLLNSAGIIRFPEFQYDMVRLGIGLYGIASTVHEQKQLQNVGTLKTTISQIRNVRANDTIGYSRLGKADKNKVIATIAIGYADGISRRLGNGAGKMIVNGAFVPTIGNICMDMSMLDVTDVQAREGDEVIVFGNEYPVHQFAKDSGMIPYEVLTGISQRVKRVFFQE